MRCPLNGKEEIGILNTITKFENINDLYGR